MLARRPDTGPLDGIGDFLTRADLPLHLRHHVRAIVFDTYHGRQGWASCERLMAAGLGEIIRLQDDLRAGRVDSLTTATRVPVEMPADTLEASTVD